MSEKMNRSVARALDILELLSSKKESLSMSEISKFLNIPKSTTFDITNTLLDRGYIENAADKQKAFRLGVKLFQTGSSYLEQTSFHEVTHSALEKLAEAAGETAFLAVVEKDQLVYIDKVDSPNSVRTSARIGSGNPLYCTGLGKAILATLTDEDIIAHLDRTGGLKPITPYTVTNLDAFMGIIHQARKQGYAVDDREHNSEVFCVAAPVFDSHGKACAAISVASLYSKIISDAQKINILGKLLSSIALDLSHRLGFKSNSLF